MKYLKESSWLEKAKELKEEYSSLNALLEDVSNIFGSYAVVAISENKVTISMQYVIDEELTHLSRDIPNYKFKGKKLVRIHYDERIKELVDALKENITVEKFLEDVLNDIDPDSLEEIYDRVIKRKGKVKEEEGCYKLSIGGKRGMPFELMLRE